MLEASGRFGPALTPVGFSSQPNRPVGVVIPRFVGRKRPRAVGGAGGGGVSGGPGHDLEEEEGCGDSGVSGFGAHGVSAAVACPSQSSSVDGGGLRDHESVLPGKQWIWCVRVCGGVGRSSSACIECMIGWLIWVLELGSPLSLVCMRFDAFDFDGTLLLLNHSTERNHIIKKGADLRVLAQRERLRVHGGDAGRVWLRFGG
jgi:hypothetical protein